MALKQMKMAPKSNKPQAVMPPVNLSSLGAGIAFQLIDAQNNPVAVPDSSLVTTTLTVDQPAFFAITAGADALHYNATVPAGTTGEVYLSATLTFNSGQPVGPFAASVKVVFDQPISKAVDLQIIVGAAN